MKQFKKLNEINEKIASVYQEIRDADEALFIEGFAEVFKQHPELVDVSWKQYTPSFNDGDACEFTFAGAYFALDFSKIDPSIEVDEEGGDNGDGRFSSWGLSYNHKHLDGTPIHKLLEEIEAILEYSEEALEATFGDGAEVTVTRDGINVEEYQNY
jgi:hypothetical protein